MNTSLLSPLALAYVGDAVYEIYVRTRIITENPRLPAHSLHTESVKYVKASAQAHSIHMMTDKLTEEETAIFKRGRNAKSPTMPKHASLTDYRHATGLEALFGWLYLNNDKERLNELMGLAFEAAHKAADNKEGVN